MSAVKDVVIETQFEREGRYQNRPEVLKALEDTRAAATEIAKKAVKSPIDQISALNAKLIDLIEPRFMGAIASDGKHGSRETAQYLLNKCTRSNRR
jgi:hypothetical protein